MEGVEAARDRLVWTLVGTGPGQRTSNNEEISTTIRAVKDRFSQGPVTEEEDQPWRLLVICCTHCGHDPHLLRFIGLWVFAFRRQSPYFQQHPDYPTRLCKPYQILDGHLFRSVCTCGLYRLVDALLDLPIALGRTPSRSVSWRKFNNTHHKFNSGLCTCPSHRQKLQSGIP